MLIILFSATMMSFARRSIDNWASAMVRGMTATRIVFLALFLLPGGLYGLDSYSTHFLYSWSKFRDTLWPNEVICRSRKYTSRGFYDGIGKVGYTIYWVNFAKLYSMSLKMTSQNTDITVMSIMVEVTIITKFFGVDILWSILNENPIGTDILCRRNNFY